MITKHEIVFTGTVGRQKKARRQVFSLKLPTGLYQDAVLRMAVLAKLQTQNAKKGKWTLQSYEVNELRTKEDSGEETVIEVRPFYDNIKTVIIGDL